MKINKGSFPNEPTCARSGRATAQKSLAGALGIPECMPPIRRRIFIVNLHAPAADAPPHRKVWRAHLAYLNACRLFGGGFS